MTGGEAALRAENDQLRSALREALHRVNVKALGVICDACGAKVGQSCYGNGPMAEPHRGRFAIAERALKMALLEGLGMKVTP